MNEPATPEDRWEATWEAARSHLLEDALAATPAQRLAWLEEMIEIAHRAGAFGARLPDPADRDSMRRSSSRPA